MARRRRSDSCGVQARILASCSTFAVAYCVYLYFVVLAPGNGEPTTAEPQLAAAKQGVADAGGSPGTPAPGLPWALHGPLDTTVPGVDAAGGPLSRNVTDFREQECTALSALPAGVVRILVVAPREPAGPVLRTIHGVLDRSPPRLLAEILVCDDTGGEEPRWLRDPEITRHIDQSLPKTRVLHFERRRVGAMMARQRATEAAVGEVVTFLDSHSEVGFGWLEPMLLDIRADARRIAFPQLDWVDHGTWQLHKGGVGCTLGFLWAPLSEHEIPEQKGHADARRGSVVASRPSPVFFGAVFSVRKDFLLELGGFDPEFGYGGGENLELSFRTWLCGGSVGCSPCSRAFIVFYKPHTNGQDPKHPPHRNVLRTAALWMDNYSSIVQAGELGSQRPREDALGPTGRMESLKRKLGCRPFQWLLDNVYPESEIVGEGSVVGVGHFKNHGTDSCLDTMQRLSEEQRPGLYPCSNPAPHSQLFVLLANGHLMPLQKMELCLDGPRWAVCQSKPQPRQSWSHDAGSLLLREAQGGRCLAAAKEPGGGVRELDGPQWILLPRA